MIEKALCLLSPTWTTAILLELATGTKRTRDLQQSLKVAGKVLSEKLTKLQGGGLVERRSYREISQNKVEYSLTASGRQAVVFLVGARAILAKIKEE